MAALIIKYSIVSEISTAFQQGAEYHLLLPQIARKCGLNHEFDHFVSGKLEFSRWR
jgi:hypothetical protein